MSLRLAFMGFRHGHILSLYQHALDNPNVEIVAACEEDPATFASFAKHPSVKLTHSSYAAMLDEVPCDAIATGDTFGRRGAILITAMERGLHVLADKPICTRLAELDRIEALSKERGLKVGAMLDLRYTGNFAALRGLVYDGLLGAIHSVNITGQHPLMYGRRPAWYFEGDHHGGTLNDIAIHAIDLLPWLTGQDIVTINAARCWNAFATEAPTFGDGAQFMLTLENGCGVIGDMSYHVPSSQGYKNPQYWRTTLYGTRGMAEVGTGIEGVNVYIEGEKAVRHIPPAVTKPGGYLGAFRHEVAGETDGLSLTTAETLRSSRVTLLLQQAADTNATNVDVR